MTSHAARARAEFDLASLGVKISVRARPGVVLSFERPVHKWTDPDSPTPVDASPLVVDEDVARAMYEALAQYFGGIGADMTALRKDYDAERRRVDKFIDMSVKQLGG